MAQVKPVQEMEVETGRSKSFFMNLKLKLTRIVLELLKLLALIVFCLGVHALYRIYFASRHPPSVNHSLLNDYNDPRPDTIPNR
jgi:hypothetical protein